MLSIDSFIHSCFCIFIDITAFLVSSSTDGSCQRRLVHGLRTYADKRYMVYLIKSYEDMDPYDSWLCGGAIVTPTQILTSAACIIDIDNMYAIAGYRYYVSGHDIDQDNCTRVKRQRIIKIRVPKEHIRYISDYQNSTRWMTLDVGVATVETPYDFEDITYRIYCSYIPSPIEINYNIHLDDKVNTSVVALGWGRDKGSAPGEVNNRNSDTLREVSLQIKNKSDCIEKFDGNGLTEMIKHYMLCTYDKGLLDGGGNVIEELDKKLLNKCDHNVNTNKGQGLSKMDASECNEEGNKPTLQVSRVGQKRVIKPMFKTAAKPMTTRKQNFKQTKKGVAIRDFKQLKRTRRQGICQNDHGGPLITWVGSTELLVGIAVNSLYDENLECVGPYLFTSTSAAGKVIRCLLSNEEPSRRSCLQEEDNFGIIETNVEHSNVTAKQNYPNNPYFRTWITEMNETRNNNKAPMKAINKEHVKENIKVQTKAYIGIADVKIPYTPKGKLEFVKKKEVIKTTERFSFLNENRGLYKPEVEEEGLSSIEVVTI